MRLRIAHLYPHDMDLYGDSGNVLVLAKRLAWRGHTVDLVEITPGSSTDIRRADVVVGGGGSDAAQRQVARDLLARRDEVRESVAAGVPMLLVCGMFQLFGRSYTPAGGREIPGLGVFDAVTTAGRRRITGAITVHTDLGSMTGYENHSGVTALAPGQLPFGRVGPGVGNGAGGGVEGAVTRAAIGTYLHGPVLAANPGLADHLLLLALRRHDPAAELGRLDAPEWQHHAAG
jgi:CobQ-like glutamine amidotransferase family enzyme